MQATSEPQKIKVGPLLNSELYMGYQTCSSYDHTENFVCQFLFLSFDVRSLKVPVPRIYSVFDHDHSHVDVLLVFCMRQSIKQEPYKCSSVPVIQGVHTLSAMRKQNENECLLVCILTTECNLKANARYTPFCSPVLSILLTSAAIAHVVCIRGAEVWNLLSFQCEHDALEFK